MAVAFQRLAYSVRYESRFWLRVKRLGRSWEVTAGCVMIHLERGRMGSPEAAMMSLSAEPRVGK